ncbi:response regulator transcription factor [Rhizobium sp. AN80A]|uniref:response regulator n=1 Tax=Rhizobium sp. AN80A TaxID=3040673 RepID=UPI0024B35BB2|nr:response regulator transcription factor [Rhizobium sp. AN80A]
MTSNMLRVAIVDDHPIFRNGLARSLSDEPGFEVVGEGASAADAVALFNEHRPDALLLDLSMPGGGHQALRSIVETDPAATVIVLTASEEDSDLFDALKEGAKGYILKGVNASTLVSAIHNVVAGESYVSPSLAARILTEMKGETALPQPAAPRNPHDDALALLTPREEQILGLVADGNSNKEVARQLNLQEKTIKHNMTRILQKLKARNRTEAAIFLRDARSRP